MNGRNRDGRSIWALADAIREFLSLLPVLDLPRLRAQCRFRTRPPRSASSSAVEVAVILAGERPPDAQGPAYRVAGNASESVTETCRQKTGSRSSPRGALWLQVASPTLWEGELSAPDDAESPHKCRRIRGAVEAGGWTLTDKESKTKDTSYAPHVRFAVASHVVTKRGSHDDGFAAMQMPDGRGSVYAVADGVGGRYNAGLFASMAVQQVLRGAYGVPLRGLVRQIGTELDGGQPRSAGGGGPFRRGIGERGNGATTLLVARSTRSALDVVWVEPFAPGARPRCPNRAPGSWSLVRRASWRGCSPSASRAYLWTPGDGLTQLTRDQRDGYGTCCLGVNHEVIPDPLEESLPPMVEGERLLLCTDGVSNALPDGRIEAILAATPDAPQDAVNRLLSEVLARGHDNATALVAEAPLAGAEGTRDQTDAFASWFGPDGRVTEAAPGSTITGVESFEPLSSLVHNVAFDEKKWGRPVVLVGRDAGTNLLRTLQRDAERFGFEILWLTARDIPTPDELAKALGENDGSEDLASLIKRRSEAAAASSDSGYGGFALLVDNAHELAPDVGRALWEAADQVWKSPALVALAGPPALRDTLRAMDVLFWEKTLTAEA